MSSVVGFVGATVGETQIKGKHDCNAVAATEHLYSNNGWALSPQRDLVGRASKISSARNGLRQIRFIAPLM